MNLQEPVFQILMYDSNLKGEKRLARGQKQKMKAKHHM